MAEEFWHDLIRLLTPNISICPYSTNSQAAEFIWNALKIQGFGWIDWKIYPQNVRIKNPSEIMLYLEKLLGRPLQESDLIVYIFCLYDLPNVIKTRLDIILKTYPDMPWTDKLWIWNPAAGYVIEDLDAGDITVGLVPKQAIPNTYFAWEKKSGLCNHQRLITLCNGFIGQTNSTFLENNQANKILYFFEKKFPLTAEKNIAWEHVQEKKVIHDPQKIIPTLKELLTSSVSTTAYINWCDPSLPLVKIKLQDAIARYDQIVAVAPKTMIFNPMTPYVIEIDENGTITVGTDTQQRNIDNA